MAEYVGLGVTPPNTFGKISQLLALQGQQAEVKSAQQSQRQRAALAKFAGEGGFDRHLGEDGTPDLNSVIADPELQAAAGDQFQDVISKVAAFKQQQLTNMGTLAALRGTQREAFGELMNGLRGDPDVAADSEAGRQKVNAAMVQYGEMYGEDAYPVLSAYSRQIQSTPKGKLGDALKIVGMQAQAVGNQMAAQAPSYQGTGGQFTQVNPNALPTSAPSLAATLPPGQQDTVSVDQLGNPYRTQRTPTGRITSTAPLPGAGGAGGPAVFGPGERGTIEAQANKNFESVSANRAAASMAPQQLDQIDKALALSEQVATGGSFGSKRAQIESNLGSLIPGFQGMDDAAKMQELEKFTERIATDASKVLGVNARTDAERESIHKQNANVGYTPKAIQAVLKYAKAQALAMEAKGDAQEAWLQREGNTIMKQHDFETQFRKAYDPRVFQFEVMKPEEQDSYWKSLSKEDRKELQDKTRALMELGAIPNG